jgi:Phosphotransferase enzyme family
MTSHSSSDSEGEDDEDLDYFKPVLASLQLQNIPSLASAVRARRTGISISIECRVNSEPLFGCDHICFPIHFVDDVRWLIRIPATGYRDRFDDITARALTSEAQTIQLLKHQTTIPVPEVFQFDASFENELNCPYILMDYINGLSLNKVWFDDTTSRDILEQRRVSVLQELASNMAQLDKFVYRNGGQLSFNQEQELTIINPIKFVDDSAMLARRKTDDPDETLIFCELGPFEDASSFFLAMLDRHSPSPDLFSQGINKLLRLFISWIPLNCPKDFVLSHPDFHRGNVLVAEDGSLRGLVDWDGVAAIPRCVGNRRYPDWIIRDWNPELYSYDPEQDDVEQREDSPEALTRYREIFARAMDQTLSECDLSQNITHNSLILENIRLAADQPFYTTSIVDKVFREITRIIAPESLEEALTESDEGDKAEDGSDIDSEGEEPKIEGGAFVDTDTDSKQGDGALTPNTESVSTDEDGESDEASDLYVYETALALAEGCLDEKRLEMLKDGFLRLFA